MKTTNNVVLITGGSAGIGFATAKLLTEQGNHVIITGRNKERLENAAAQLQNVTAIQCDVTDDKDVHNLVQRIQKDFPQLNILINNAGQAYMYNLATATNVREKAADEMKTNFLSVISLTEQLLPLLKQQPVAAIVNVTSVLALVPASNVPSYSASKAALRAHTQLLRHAMEGTSVKVFELMPPLVNTEFSKEIGGHNGIAPAEVAQQLLDAIETDTYEVRVGLTAQIYDLARQSPEAAFKAINSAREAV